MWMLTLSSSPICCWRARNSTGWRPTTMPWSSLQKATPKNTALIAADSSSRCSMGFGATCNASSSRRVTRCACMFPSGTTGTRTSCAGWLSGRRMCCFWPRTSSASRAGRPSMSFLRSSRLYRIDFSREFDGQCFECGMEAPALPLGQFVQQIGIRRDLAAGKRGVASRVGHAAAHIDQIGHVPTVPLPWRMMLGDNGFKLRGHLPISDQLPAGLTMIPSEQLSLGIENAGGRTAVNSEQEAVLLGPDYGQRQSPYVVHHARGECNILIQEADESQLFGDQGTGQVVAPDSTHTRLVQRFAHVCAHADCQAESLQVICAQHRDSLQNAAGGKPRSIQERIRDGKDFAGKGRIGRDQPAQLVQ